MTTSKTMLALAALIGLGSVATVNAKRYANDDMNGSSERKCGTCKKRCNTCRTCSQRTCGCNRA